MFCVGREVFAVRPFRYTPFGRAPVRGIIRLKKVLKNCKKLVFTQMYGGQRLAVAVLWIAEKSLQKVLKFLQKSLEVKEKCLPLRSRSVRTDKLIEMMIKDKQHIQQNMYSVQERKYVKVYYNER